MFKIVEIKKYNGLIKDIDLIVLTDQKLVNLNNKMYSIDDDFIEKLIRIIRLWKNNYNSKIIDDNYLEMIINKKELIRIKGVLPSNYVSFIELLKGLNDEDNSY